MYKKSYNIIADGWGESVAASLRVLPKLKPPSEKAACFVEHRFLNSYNQEPVLTLKILEIIVI
jgi:hypothetical protein